MGVRFNCKRVNNIHVYSKMMYAVGILAFKSVKGLAPSYLSGRLGAQSFVHDRNIRNTNSLIN